MTTIPTNPAAQSASAFERRFGQPRRRGEPVQREQMGKLFDREPPRSVEAEMSLLGSMILDGRVISEVIQIVRGPEMFYSDAHGLIFSAIVSIADKHNAIDTVLLCQKLRDQGALELVGGDQYIIRLAAEVPTASNAPHFARLVADKFRLRKLIDAAGEILFDTYHNGMAEGDEAKRVIDSAEQKIFEIAQEEQISDIESLEVLVTREYERLQAYEDGHAPPSGVSTGYHDLDKDLGGLQPGEMILLAARPSMGKTALVLNLAEQIALGTDQPASIRSIRERAPVGMFSLEMSKSALTQRLMSSWSGIGSQKIRAGTLSSRAPNDEYAVLLQATQQLGTAPLFIDDTPGLTVTALRARARRMVAQHGVKCLMIDYLQLLSAPMQAKENRQVEVSTISRGIKALARELNVPIIALSQLNRGPEGREGNKPRLSDLRESGSLEQDADVVLLLHREEYYHIQDEEWKANNADKIGVAEVIIAKQRNGPTGIVKLAWDPNTTRFRNYTEGGMPEYPTRHYEPPTMDTAPPSPPPSRGFHPGKQSGPIDDHRDGGGPERGTPPGDDDMGDEIAPF